MSPSTVDGPVFDVRMPLLGRNRFYSFYQAPTLAEAVVVASLVVNGTGVAERTRWLELLQAEEDSFSTQQAAWRPPSSKAWQRGHGQVHRVVEGIQRDGAILNRCIQAVVKLQAAETEPSVDAVKSYLRKLTSGKLPMAGVPKLPRNAWVYMEAARLVRHQAAALGVEDPGDASSPALTPMPATSERWILKKDLNELRSATAVLKSECRNLQRQVERLSTSERLAIERAERAEERAAIARSEQDGLASHADELQALIDARRAKASGEVLELRREVEHLKVSERLASTRAARAEERAAVARSEEDQACERAAIASRLAATAAENAAKLAAENEVLRVRAERSYTAKLMQKIEEQDMELKALRERRANNMAATRQLNLEKQRCRQLKEQAEMLTRAVREHWGRDTMELAEAGAAVPMMEAQLECLRRAVAELEAENEELRRVVCPAKPMEGGHFNSQIRFMVMKLIGMANVPHTNVPQVIDITSEYFGIQLPGRWRKVLISAAGGVRTYAEKWIRWRPCAGTCENIR